MQSLTHRACAVQTPVVKEEHRSAAKATKSGADELGDFLGSRQGKAIQREVIRGVFGMLRKRI